MLVEVSQLLDVLRVDNLDGQFVAGHGAPLRVARKRHISDGQRGSDEEALEVGRRQGVEADGAVLGAGNEEILRGSNRNILLLAVVNVDGLAVRPRLVEADGVVGPHGDQPAAVLGVGASRRALGVRRPRSWTGCNGRVHDCCLCSSDVSVQVKLLGFRGGLETGAGAGAGAGWVLRGRRV